MEPFVAGVLGSLIDRVRPPYGRVISGVGGGVVYMGALDGSGAHLEMARST